jgi:hypothetical protein
VRSCRSELANFANLAESLSRLYKRATETLHDVKRAFDELTDGRDPALVAQWEKESVEAKKNKKGHWESVYRLPGKWEEGILISRFLMFCSDVYHYRSSHSGTEIAEAACRGREGHKQGWEG